MSKTKILSCAVVGALSIGLALAAQETLNVKTGLWEMTVVTRLSGALPIPDDALAKMSPEQRAQIEAAYQAKMSAKPTPEIKQSCLTKEKLEEGFAFNKETNPNCKRTSSQSSATTVDLKEECTTDQGSSTVSIHYVALTPEKVTGTGHLSVTSGGHTMVSDMTVSGKWLNSNCGEVK